MDEEDEVSSGEAIIKDEKDDEDDEDFRPGRTYKPRRGGTASGVRGGRKRKKQASRGWDPDDLPPARATSNRDFSNSTFYSVINDE
jgi:hypothetical protein